MSSNTPDTLGRAVSRGFRCRCPACGESSMFSRFLKVDATCRACGEELHHHRADDLPAYLVVVIVGHVLLSLTLWVEIKYSPDYWVYAVTFLPLSLAMIFGLIQPIKGMIVAVQWHLGMHGFSTSRAQRRSV